MTSSRVRTAALICAGYMIIGAVMLAPITNYRHLASATYGSDTRLTVWILAWINHVTLDGGSLFDANVFYPARNTLAYAEHLLSISVFTLPTYALTRNPDLAYNIAWLLSYFTCALAAHALAWRVTRDHLASFVGGVAYAFCFYRMLHGHAHIQLLWACWVPLSFLLLEWWWRRPSWPRIALLWLVVLMQVLASWYLAIMVLIADALLALYLAVWVRPPRRLISTMLAQVAAAAIAGAIVVWPIARHYTFLVALNGDSQAEAADVCRDAERPRRAATQHVARPMAGAPWQHGAWMDLGREDAVPRIRHSGARSARTIADRGPKTSTIPGSPSRMSASRSAFSRSF